MSLATKLPLDVFTSCLNQPYEIYDTLWISLRSIVSAHQKSLPEKSSLTAWERATDHYGGVSLTGDFKYAEKPGGPILDFSLRALKVEKSYRFARKFGGDRFCILGLPGISTENLPGYLKSKQPAVQENIDKLLVDTNFCFLGRIWRAFYLKPDAKKTRRGKQSSLNETKFRIYFFAEDGQDFGSQPLTGEADPRTVHAPLSISQLIDWFMPAKNNPRQTSLKFFTRLALGVSTTTPTLIFHPNEIIRTLDARADNPGVRRVNPEREGGTSSKVSDPKVPVMNDVSFLSEKQ